MKKSYLYIGNLVIATVHTLIGQATIKYKKKEEKIQLIQSVS